MLSPEERKLEPLKDLASRSGGWLECRILPVASRPWGIDVPADYARGQPTRLMEWQERAREEEGCWAVAEADADADAEMGLSASRSRFCDGPGEACGSGRSPTEASS